VDYHPANAYRNGTLYASYTASSFAKKYALADKHGIDFEGALSWSFEFEGKPWFAGFRSMATNGVAKPVLNVFRMFGMMGGDRVAVSQPDAPSAEQVIRHGVRGDARDVNALASTKANTAYVMVWNYHDDNLPAAAAEVSVHVRGIPAEQALLHHYRIDEDHSNAYTVWLEMGAPQQVSRDQYARLEQSGHLELLTSPEWIESPGNEATIHFTLPRQGTSLLQLSW
jgi:xylan 1,4-beta-xylosidase